MTPPERPRRAIYPGSFDPVTNGHEDIARRALRFSDEVIVAVARQATEDKDGLFTVDERIDMLRELFADEPRIDVRAFGGLLVEFARESGARLVVRGLRAVSDFEYEFQMALMNRELWDEVETVFLAPSVEYSYLSASLVREIASLGGEVGEFVAPPVRARLEARLGEPSG